ncbi:MAG: hypothetical protein WC679_09805 [Bacteroidales bacterium]|jgi:hypothetical protein
MKKKILISIVVLLIGMVLLVNAFTRKVSNKYLGNVPMLILEMQKQKDEIEKKAKKCSNENGLKILNDKSNKINKKYNYDLYKKEFDKVKNAEITCDVSEGVPLKVILSPKFTSINKDQCVTIEGLFLTIKDLNIDANKQVNLYLKYEDKNGKAIDLSIFSFIPDKLTKENTILAAGEKIRLKALECINPKNAERWIDFEKIGIITEDEYKNTIIKK